MSFALRANPMHARFCFTVSGTIRVGVLYVTAPCAIARKPSDAELAYATRLAAKRAGDPAPHFVHIAT